MSPRAAYAAILHAFAPHRARFEHAIAHPAEAQRARIASTMEALDLPGSRTFEGFSRCAPVVGPEDLRMTMRDVVEGHATHVRGQRVLFVEETGGTTGGSRHVPISARFLNELHAGLAPWLHDLFSSHPRATDGRAYWAISPMARGPRVTPGGIPIGAPDDAVYFPPTEGALLGETLAVGSELAHLHDVEACRFATALRLIACEDLAFISVWSPTFLSLLMQIVLDDHVRLSAALARGDASERRAQRRLRAALDSETPFVTLWPSLALVSMWCDASSALFVDEVRRALPHACIAPKGLLATEGLVSVPLSDADGPVLAVDGHVLEFLPVEDAGARPLFAHELSDGARYEVVLTTGAGLVRQRMGDVVEVVGRQQRTPCVRFVGRTTDGADLVGEKLHADVVERAVRGALEASRVTSRLALLAPTLTPRLGYRLYLDSRAPDAALCDVARRVDAALCREMPYAHARALGQLAPVAAARVVDGLAGIERRALARGQRAGNVKPPSLSSHTDWDTWLKPLAIDEARALKGAA